VNDTDSLLGGGVHIVRHRADAPKHRLRQALAVVDPRSAVALRLRLRLTGDQSYRPGEVTEMLALLEEARSATDPVVRAEALSMAHHSLLGPEHSELRQTLASDLIAESFRTGQRRDLLMGVLWQTIDMFMEADARAVRRLGELRELLSDEDDPAIGYVVQVIEVMLTIRMGDLDRAEALAHATARRGATAGYVGAAGMHAAQLLAIRWYQGRVAETLPDLTKLVASHAQVATKDSYLAALAFAAAAAGDRDRAEMALATLCGSDLAELPRSSSWLTRMCAIVEAAHLLDDVRLAVRAYELLQPYAHLPMLGTMGAVCFGSVHHALAVAALTTGHLDRAVGHLDAAIQQNRAIGHWPAAVASRMRLAQALTLRGRAGDDVEADRQRAAAARVSSVADSPGADRPGEAKASLARAALTCVRDGRDWLVSLGGRHVRVGHRIGMLHLTVLVANAGQEIDALELVAGPSHLSRVGQPVLDRVAIGEYRRRLGYLRQEIDDREADNDTDGAARARAEREWLLAELASATGLGGRIRAFPTDHERARISVGKAIRRALTYIAELDPIIGEHLARTVHTGARCSYRPG